MSLYFDTYYVVDAKKNIFKKYSKMVLIIKCLAFQGEIQIFFQLRIPLRETAISFVRTDIRGLGPYTGKLKVFSLTSKGGVPEKSLFSSGGSKML